MKITRHFPLSLITLVFFGAMFSFPGCAKKRPPGMSLTQPDWVVKGSGVFKDSGEDIFYGVGSVIGVHNKPLAVATADNRARAEIAKVFETYTAYLMKDYAASTMGGGAVTKASASSEEQHVEQAIKTFSAVTLSGVMIIDHWTDSSDGIFYSLAKLDLKNFKKNLEKIKELNDKVKEYVRKNAENAFKSLAEEEEKRGN